MSQRLVDLDMQLLTINVALSNNRLEAAADEMMVLFHGSNNRRGGLVDEGHIERILGTIAQKEPALAVEAAQRALKVAPALVRPALVDSLLNSAENNSAKNRPLALKALFTAATIQAMIPSAGKKPCGNIWPARKNGKT